MSKQVPFSVVEWYFVKAPSYHHGSRRFDLIQEIIGNRHKIKFPRFAYFTDNGLFLYFMIGFHIAHIAKEETRHIGWRVCRIDTTTNSLEYRSPLCTVEMARTVLKKRLIRYDSPKSIGFDGW